MHLKQTVITALLVSVTLTTGAQHAFITRALSEVQGIEEAHSRTFTDASLYGYINGGAELYLEYGFDTLIVTELVCEGRDIKVELYRMKDPEAAFGIFSVSRFRCNGGAPLTEYVCRSAYQLQFSKGPYYVSIINDTGSESDQRKSGEIASLIIGQIAEPPFDPGGFFAEGVDQDEMRGAVLVRGPLGIYNGIPSLVEKFGEASGYSALMIRKGQDTLASLRFNTEESANAYLKWKTTSPALKTKALSSDSTVSIISPNHIIITF
ncbi:MAG: hypothetical protein IH592_02970 [Bacteroidales bacterium]|nr:hypothetical protein [Bacteroidales bacterium]